MAKVGGKRDGAGRKPGKVGAAKRAIADMAKVHAVAALKTLADIANDRGAPHSARVAAANHILDRAYGRPPQALEHTGANGGPIELARIERVVIDPGKTKAEAEHAYH